MGGGNWEHKKRSRFGGIFDKYEIKATRTGGNWNKKYSKGDTKENFITHWDVAPDIKVFEEIFINPAARLKEVESIF